MLFTCSVPLDRAARNRSRVLRPRELSPDVTTTRTRSVQLEVRYNKIMRADWVDLLTELKSCPAFRGTSARTAVGRLTVRRLSMSVILLS